MSKSKSTHFKYLIPLFAFLLVTAFSVKAVRAGDSYPAGEYNITDLDADNMSFDGDVTINLNEDAERWTLSTDYNLTIKGPGTLALTSAHPFISCKGKLTICDGAKVFVYPTDRAAISAYSILIENSTVNANVSTDTSSAIKAETYFTITNSSVTVSAKGTHANGIFSGDGGFLEITSSTIYADATSAGMFSFEGAEITDSMVTLTGSKYGFYSSLESLKIYGKTRFIASGGTEAIHVDDSFHFEGQYLETNGPIFAKFKVTWDESLYKQTPKNPKFANYMLCNEDGTPASKVLFVQKNLEEHLAVISDIPDQTYTGNPIKPPVTVTWDGAELKEGTDYSLTYENNTEAGNASVKVTGIHSFGGSIKKPFKIVKMTSGLKKQAKTQKVTVKKKTVTLKASKLKNKAQTVKASKVKKGNKAKTKITYKLVKVNRKAFKKYFKVNKTGKITVKKNLKKGTYKLTIKATAAKTAAYKSASKNFVVTIKVK